MKTRASTPRRDTGWVGERLSWVAPDQAWRFVGNFGVMAVADGWAGAVGLVVAVLAGRLLGAEEFGAYALVFSAAQFLLLPMMCGWNTAALRQLPARPEQRSETVTAVGAGFLVTAAGALGVLAATRDWWLGAFGVSPNLAGWALALSVLTGISTMTEAVTRGLERYSVVARGVITASLALLGAFLLLRLGFDIRTYMALVGAVAARLLAFTVVLGVDLARQDLRWRWSRATVDEVVRYSVLATLGGLAGTVILQADRFFLQHWTSLASVGVYAAYATGTQVFGRLFQVFVNVYFPTVAGSRNRGTILARLGDVYRVAAAPLFLMSLASISAVVLLFGGDFPFRWDLAVLCAVNSCLAVFYELHMWLLNAEGTRGVGASIRISFAGAVATIGLLRVLVPWWGIDGALIAQLLVNGFLCVAFRHRAWRVVGGGPEGLGRR